MKACIALLITSLFFAATARAQTYEWLKPKLATADTIVLASHEDFNAMDNGTDNPVPVPAWVVNGHPNYKALLKYKALTPTQRIELSRILLRPFADKQIVTMHCCQPHNLVFLVRNGRTSYLDICFGCRCIHSSKDLAGLYALDDRKWAELRRFFTRLGLDYGF
jgi:hypothetical protein